MTVPVIHRYFKVSCPTCEEDFFAGEIPSEARLRAYFRILKDARDCLLTHWKEQPSHKPKLEELTKQEIPFNL